MKLVNLCAVLLSLLSCSAIAAPQCAQYISVREYDVSDSVEITRRAQQEFVPIINKIPGFLSWQLIEVSKTRLITVSAFNSQQAAELSAEKAKQWGAKSLANLVKNTPEISNGKVVASSCM